MAVVEGDLPERLRRALGALARERRCITYRALAALVEAPPPHGIHKVTEALEGLVRADHAAGRPLLAALAVSRTQPGIPGRGFFQLLRELGRYDGPDDGPEAVAAYRAELAAAWDHWDDTGQA